MGEFTNKYSWQFDPLFPDKPVEITCNGIIIATSSLGNAQKLVNALNVGEDMYEALKRVREYCLGQIQSAGTDEIEEGDLLKDIEKTIIKADGES